MSVGKVNEQGDYFEGWLLKVLKVGSLHRDDDAVDEVLLRRR